MRMWKKLNRKGSAEVAAIVILVVIAGILALTIASGNAKSLLDANEMAQEVISLSP